MKTSALFALVLALGVGTASMLRTDHHNHFSSPNGTAAQSTDGAFRDGLYLGTLAAGRGAESHIAIGRWATPEDRSSFTAGYQQAYSEFLASRVAPTTPGRRTD
jgi:hypothetical protein